MEDSLELLEVESIVFLKLLLEGVLGQCHLYGSLDSAVSPLALGRDSLPLYPFSLILPIKALQSMLLLSLVADTICPLIRHNIRRAVYTGVLGVKII